MTSFPLVSVAIPAYNHAAFIETCLASVCAQTYPELELVLIDDGSTDGTFEVAQRFLEPRRNRFRRIVLEQRANQGVSGNSNACIEACQGEWVHLVGSDDVLYPNLIERSQHHINEWQSQSLALVHADCDFIDVNGCLVVPVRPKTRPPAGPDFQAYQWLFLGKHYIFNPTISLKRSHFLATGGFDKTLALEDLDCWLRLSTRYSIGRIPEVLASYRKHPGNASRRRIQMLGAQFMTFAKFLQAHPKRIDDASIRSHFRQNLKRFWRRTRARAPWGFLRILFSAFISLCKTPKAHDYAKFGAILNSMHSSSSKK